MTSRRSLGFPSRFCAMPYLLCKGCTSSFLGRGTLDRTVTASLTRPMSKLLLTTSGVVIQRRTSFRHSSLTTGCAAMLEHGVTTGCAAALEPGVTTGCAALLEPGVTTGCAAVLEPGITTGCAALLEPGDEALCLDRKRSMRRLSKS